MENYTGFDIVHEYSLDGSAYKDHSFVVLKDSSGTNRVPLNNLQGFKGELSVAGLESLTGMVTGDVYAMTDDGTFVNPDGSALVIVRGDFVQYDGSKWNLLIRLSNYVSLDNFRDVVEFLTAAIANAFANVHAYARGHIEDTGNPHSVTAEQVGAYTSGEVDDAVAAATTEVTQGTNCTVDESTASDGHKVYNISVPDGTISGKGVVQLEDSTSSTSTDRASTPNSVKTAYDIARSAVQNVKVNGTVLSKDATYAVDVPVPTGSDSNPSMDGMASAGSSMQWSKGDHVHPTDTSREAVENKITSIRISSQADNTKYPSELATRTAIDSAEASAKTVVAAGENCSVTKTTAADGHDVYTINADGKPQVQSDWSQNDSTAVDFIRNKPIIPVSSDMVPQMDGTASAGTSMQWSRGDHVHPTDTSREAVSNKVTSWSSTLSDTKYPSEKLVKESLDNLPPGTAVKGDAESVYRTGNVNLTPANIGAYSKTESDARYKAVQTPVSDPTASGSGLSFIDSVSQDANGVVTPHKKTVQDGTVTQKGVVKLNNAIDSTSTTEAATPKAVKDAYDELNNKIVARAVFLSQQEWAAQSLLPGDPAKVYYVEDGTGEDAYTVYVWNASTSAYVEVDESSIDLNGYWHDGPTTTGNGNVVTGITLGNDGVPVLEKGITALTQHQDISGKLDTTGNASNTTSTFTKASGDTSSMASGSKLSAIFTAISSFFASLKALAFKDNVSDSDISGTISDSHIASASTWNGKQNALPTSGTPSDTYAVNISGNAATASMASSVSWDNVSGKPTIPSSDSDLTNDRYVRYDTDSQGLGTTEQGNARTNIGAGTYTKPLGGIPNTDLASAVQTSLGKADSSIQSVKANGTALSPDANKGVDIPPASTSVYGVVTFTEVELDDI